MSTIARVEKQEGGWGPPKVMPVIDSDGLKIWEEARSAVAECGIEKGLSRSKMAEAFGIPLPTLTQWFDGNYGGSFAATTARVQKGLQSLRDRQILGAAALRAPSWIETPTARELRDTLIYAQTMPEMVIATLGAGMGKTTTARHYAATRANVCLAIMRPRTANMHSMLAEIAAALDVTERNPAWLDRAIGTQLKRNGRQTLLIIDEAQNLGDQSVNQLRYWLDEYECGIALLGNEEIYTRYGRSDPREGYGQIHRRIGKRLRRLQPLAGDIDALMDAWGIADGESRRLLAAIGRKPGALGQLDKTLRLAAILAAGDGVELTAAHIRSAWQNRGGEVLS